MLDAYNVAARMSAKYGLSEAQEHVLRALMTGLPDGNVQRFLGRGEDKLRRQRQELLSRFGNLDRLHFYLATWRNRRVRIRELRSKAIEEAEQQLLRKKRAQ